jgi:hypothetical protein
MARYFTNIGPERGPIFREDGYAAIDVVRDPDLDTPIGTARPVGCTDGGIVIWDIFIMGMAMPEPWIVLGREFVPRR